MSKIEKRLSELGITLPKVSIPIASYIPAIKVSNLIFTSGQLPFIDGEITCTGLVGRDVEVEAASNAARVCTINALAAIREIIIDLDRIKQVVKITGFVAGAPTFTQQPAVINGSSNLILEIFGEKGKHTRSAVGMSSLPLNSSVEIEFIFEVE
jgi:enamine deaminase RidA (YjgF/YER057c/UK114 family)